MSRPKYAEYFIEEEPIITDQQKKIQVFHLVPKDEDIALDEWSEKLRENYSDKESLLEMSSSMGISTTEYLKKHIFPDFNNRWGKITMVGDFTEILIADYLQYVRNFVVPRTRYSNKIDRNRSTQGSDLLAYHLQKNGNWDINDELLVFEVKAQSSETKTKPRLQDAVNDSSKDIARLAESLIASANLLRMSGNTSQAQIVMRFLNATDRPYKSKYGGAAVYSDFSFSRDSLKTVDTSKHPKSDIDLLVIHCNKLINFIKEMYERATRC